jgi:hypothetical protein
LCEKNSSCPTRRLKTRFLMRFTGCFKDLDLNLVKEEG